MTLSCERRSPVGRAAEEEIARLKEENRQLRQAVDSHAVIDQAIGVLIALHRLTPATGWEVLRETSQHLNIKLRTIAELVVHAPSGRPLPGHVRHELSAAVRRQDRTAA
ncbi:ANTAR domain-containing protein [Streptomyces spectabilis]|uniref:ANTAR domain-containing protein n=1 Tax=Streptomyces spectabilis TaxID=68270 RepID=UPI003407B518